ncbi:MAG: hypothetical protein ACKOYJ_02435 [Planctomycetia bacterium]
MPINPSFRRRRRAIVAAVAVGTALTAAPLFAHEFGRMARSLAAPVKAMHRERPVPRHAPGECDDSIHRLAAQIDWLKHHIDAHGSIVAKQPDVWGQSRLMRHRHEYEAQMQRQLGEFAARSQAAIRRSDQTFLSMALALEDATDRRRFPDVSAVAKPHDFEKALPLDVTDRPVSLEPTVHLDQLSRYLNHLHELRRINEGDDSADAPGYSLNLLRIPVSVMPGKHTQRGHGAEITVIAEPSLGDSLLPATFRSLVINDLVDLIAPALTHCVNDPQCLQWARTITAPADPETAHDAAPTPARQGVIAAMRSLSARLPTIAPSAAPSLKTRRARMPIPFSQLADVSGIRQIAILVDDTHTALANHPASRPCIEYVDVRTYLAEELEAAADFLAQERQRPLWNQLPEWNIAELVRSRRINDLARIRCHVFTTIGAGDDLGDILTGMPIEIGDGRCCDERLAATPVCRTTTAVLAWGMLVESALLNERLIDDIRESGCGPCDAGFAGPFFGPDPSPEARAAFNAYVRCRWPIRVFALDPVAEQQNVEDVFARRRELQVAMAMAFASGRLSASTMNRFSRRLETDMATIDLNKTAVAFSHGADTFGWRFYPRVQTPPTRGTLAAFAETLCGPGTDADIAQRKLEPGQRECTAIIVMPSFVPSLTLDVRSNWFALGHAPAADPTMQQTMILSRSVQAMRESAAACSRCVSQYPPGAFATMMRSVDQLERQLPLQTLRAQIPHENTCGGFELFNTGITDLAPELVGWYGAPGIDPDGTTSLFLIGKGFSVHDTTVIAGGKPVPCTLISREVLKAEIPAGVATLEAGSQTRCEPCILPAVGGRMRPSTRGVRPAAAVEPLPPPADAHDRGPAVADESCFGDCGGPRCNEREIVDIHLATPYGVSSHLLVPVARRRTRAECGLAIEAGFEIGLTFTAARTATSPTPTARLDEFFSSSGDHIVIRTPPVFVPPTKSELRLLLRDTATGSTAARFSFAELPFDAGRRGYVIAGGDLRNFIGDTSRPATDKTLRGAVKPWLDSRLAVGELADDGDAASFTLTASLVAGQQEVPIDGSIAVTATRRGKVMVDPAPETP